MITSGPQRKSLDGKKTKEKGGRPAKKGGGPKRGDKMKVIRRTRKNLKKIPERDREKD